MLQFNLQQVGKRFGKQWLFKNVSARLLQGKTYALTGNNGSGKSTLLQIIYGYQSASKGVIELINTETQTTIPNQKIHSLISYVAPYLDLPDELTLEEQLTFHFNFKTLQGGVTINDVINEIWLDESRHKKVKHFSSGMKQRVKLAQAFYADSPILFFDEPCTNLDSKGIAWYRDMVLKHRENKLVVIASNQTFEYDFADEVIHVGE